MRRGLALLIGLMTTAAIAGASPAVAADAPIGRLGDTLRIETTSGIIADVTVHDVAPTAVPPGWTWTGHPGWREDGGPWRAGVTVHVIKSPNPYALAVRVTFNGVAPMGDAYVSKHTYAPDSLENLLANAPAGSTVTGGVYWHVYRAHITNVMARDTLNNEHLAQWNL